MSFSAHKRDALDATLPLSHRMSHLRSCAMLMGEKYRVPRSVIIERVSQLCGVDITNPATDHEILRAVQTLVQIKVSGLGDPAATDAGRPAGLALNWLAPWCPITDASIAKGLSRELHDELSARHVLYGIEVSPVARRQDCDDVLFALLDGSGRFAVVHLTYAQHPEPEPRWPDTVMYADWSQFEQERMRSDAADWPT